MTTAFLILQYLPVIIAAMKAAEETFPAKGSGPSKLALVLAAFDESLPIVEALTKTINRLSPILFPH